MTASAGVDAPPNPRLQRPALGAAAEPQRRSSDGVRKVLMKTIRPADPEEAQAISALAIRSKAHWGYPPEQMSVFSRELTLSPSDIAARHAHVLEENGQVVGFYTLATRADDDAELEHLFVEPSGLRRGSGAALFRHACALAREAGFGRLVIQSDPNAAGFYLSVGARLERCIPSSIPGRELPFFSLELAERVAAQPGLHREGLRPAAERLLVRRRRMKL